MTSARERHRLRAEAAHAHAQGLKGPRWLCHRPECPIAGQPQPEPTVEAALAASSRHQSTAHPDPGPPADLDEQRAAWRAAGYPPLGARP